MEKVPMTAQGLAVLEEELKRLKEERPLISKAIGVARELGDLSENAEYHAAKERQSHIAGRIASTEDKLARAQIIDLPLDSASKVQFGATVVLAGNMEGQTRTIALAVYSLLESPSGQGATWTLVIASVMLSLVALLGFERLTRWQRRRIEDHHGGR